MCLDTKWTEKEKQELLDSHESDWIEVWKVVRKNINYGTQKNEWGSLNFSTFKYKHGRNKCRENPMEIEVRYSSDEGKYKPYYHFYYCEGDVAFLRNVVKHYGHTLLRCYVRKEDIDTIGTQEWRSVTTPSDRVMTTIVAKEAIFPTCPRTYLTTKEKRLFGIK